MHAKDLSEVKISYKVQNRNLLQGNDFFCPFCSLLILLCCYVGGKSTLGACGWTLVQWEERVIVSRSGRHTHKLPHTATRPRGFAKPPFIPFDLVKVPTKYSKSAEMKSDPEVLLAYTSLTEQPDP